MKLIFNGMDELRAFLAEIDGDGTDDAAEQATGTTRRKRRTRAEIEAANAAQGQVQTPAVTPGFAPPPTVAPVAPPASTGFAVQPTFAPPATAPVQAQQHPLVAQIVQKTDQALAAGQPLDAVIGWFRGALGAEAAQANWEQIKAAFLPKTAEPLLKDIASKLGIQV